MYIILKQFPKYIVWNLMKPIEYNCYDTSQPVVIDFTGSAERWPPRRVMRVMQMNLRYGGSYWRWLLMCRLAVEFGIWNLLNDEMSILWLDGLKPHRSGCNHRFRALFRSWMNRNPCGTFLHVFIVSDRLLFFLRTSIQILKVYCKSYINLESNCTNRICLRLMKWVSLKDCLNNWFQNNQFPSKFII